ncbi:TPA: hypoxanthine phosphoribosyltransferase [Candidatus Gastranaerophilales bacterium HUM_9]|nr:MAG TPA: hypoxanthine phosphoribosyltransferase [Candidatus Gastranaerophilales bacterium HUM_9]HBX34145.1 hypoxanthine phosphoribosyltransferase [Cyanobacteria bacterium UBA11440]
MKPITEKDIKVLFTEEDIQTRIKELAKELNKEYAGQELYAICVLKGSVMFMVDFLKHITVPTRMEFIRLSSYGSNYTSTGEIHAVDLSLPDLNGKNVIIIEDIVDTGHTAQFLTTYLKHHFKMKSYKFISLLDKKCRREVEIEPDMYGFEIDDKFLVGYGLDYDGFYRNLTYVGYVEI